MNFHESDTVEFDVAYLFNGHEHSAVITALITNIYPTTARVAFWNFFTGQLEYRELEITDLRLSPEQEPHAATPPNIIYFSDTYFMAREDNMVFSAAVTLDLSQSSLPASPPTIEEKVYDSVKAPLPAGLPSQSYEAYAVGELGQRVTLGASARILTSVVVCLQNWGYQSKYGLPGNTWNGDITLNLYRLNDDDSSPLPGPKLLTVTRSVAIPWRPEPDATCPGTRWRAPDGCHNGQSLLVTFDNLDPVALPEQLIFGVAFNTQSGGQSPVGFPTPANDLNFSVDIADPATIGVADTNQYLNSSNPTSYTDQGAAGVGIFRLDVGAEPADVTLCVTINAKKNLTPAGMAYSHRKVSGPGCTFSNSRAPVCQVTLSDAGTYVFEGKVTDLATGLASTQQLTITVKAKIPGLIFNNTNVSVYVSTRLV